MVEIEKKETLNDEKLEKAIYSVVEGFGYKPNPIYVKEVISATSHMKSNERIMFIAHLVHETAGLSTLEEEDCKNKICPQYGTGAQDKSYHGRGFIQLTWPENYKAASQDLGYNNLLYGKPELVSEDPKIAMETSLWYWNDRVVNQPDYDPNNFGSTTKAINGALESNLTDNPSAKNRYDLYVALAKSMDIKNLSANEES